MHWEETEGNKTEQARAWLGGGDEDDTGAMTLWQARKNMSQVENKKHKGLKKDREIQKKQKALPKQKGTWNKIKEGIYRMLQDLKVQAKDFSFHLCTKGSHWRVLGRK